MATVLSLAALVLVHFHCHCHMIGVTEVAVQGCLNKFPVPLEPHPCLATQFHLDPPSAVSVFPGPLFPCDVLLSFQSLLCGEPAASSHMVFNVLLAKRSLPLPMRWFCQLLGAPYYHAIPSKQLPCTFLAEQAVFVWLFFDTRCHHHLR